MKKTSIILSMCLLLLLVGCNSTDQSKKEPNSMFQINVSSYPSDEETGNEFSPVSITDSKEISKIITMFDGWNKEDHIVPSKEILDSVLDIQVQFADGMTIYLFSSSLECNGYGRIKGEKGYYYLPTEFVEYILNLLKK